MPRLAKRTALLATCLLALASPPRADEPLTLPSFTFQGEVLDKASLRFNPINELISPSVIRAADSFANPVATYYMY